MSNDKDERMVKREDEWIWGGAMKYADEHAGEFVSPLTGDALIAQTVTERTNRLVAEYNAAVLDRINQLFNPRPR